MTFRQTAMVLVATAVALAGTSLPAAESLTIERLKERKSEWPGLVESQVPLTIEGRYSAFSSKLLRFQKCDDLNFIWHDDEQPFPVDPTSLRSRTIEVYGRFGLQSGKPTFRVERVRELPSDAETLRARRVGLLEAPAAEWYALGEWALHRGTFYADLDLQMEARRLFAEGIRRETQSLPDTDVDAKIALSRKFRQYGLADEQRVAFLHETFVRRWRSMQGTKAAAHDLEQLSDRIQELLRGARTPLTEPDERLVQRYRRNPAALYRESPSPTRARLDRMLFTEVRFAFLQAWARQTNQEGGQLADRIDREVPEYHAEAEKLRDQALDEKLAIAATMSRRDVLALAERLVLRGQPEKALAAKKAWVAAGDERLRNEGRPDDLIQAAREHQSMLDDKEGAAALLIQAYEKAPEMKDISERLEALGWTRVGAKWITRAQAAALPPDPSKPADDALHLQNKTRDQVRKALGSPDSVTRVISAGRLNEVWIYKENARSQIAIHFLGNTDGRDLRVVRLVQ